MPETIPKILFSKEDLKHNTGVNKYGLISENNFGLENVSVRIVIITGCLSQKLHVLEVSVVICNLMKVQSFLLLSQTCMPKSEIPSLWVSVSYPTR